MYAAQAGPSFEASTRDRVAKIPLGRAAQPRDVARVVVFLAFFASKGADDMTERALNVAGGPVTF